MAHGDFELLTPEAIDKVWVRLKAGQAAKPTARANAAGGYVWAHLHRRSVGGYGNDTLMGSVRRRYRLRRRLLVRSKSALCRRGVTSKRMPRTSLT